MLSLHDPEQFVELKKRLSAMPFQSPPAVVVGDSINALGVVRSLGKERIPVVWLTSNPHSFVNWSRFSWLNVSCNDVYYDGLTPTLIRLGSIFPTRPVMFLTHDFQVKQVSSSHDQLSPYYQFHLPPDLLVGQLLSKFGFFELAQQLNVPIPSTVRVSDTTELSSFIEAEGKHGCWVVKPFEKNDQFEDLFGKAIRIEGEGQWSQFKIGYEQLNVPIIIQTWISGEDNQVCFCLVVFDSDHRCLLSFAGRKIRQFKPQVGNTASAEPFPRREICQLTEAFFEKVSFTGIGSLEFKYSVSRQQYIAVEPTIGRTNLQSEIAPLNHCNLPAVYYFDVLGNIQHRDQLIQKGKGSKKKRAWVRFHADLKSGLFYYKQSRLSLKSWMAFYCRPISFSVFRWDDPVPFVMLVAKTLVEKTKSQIAALLKCMLGKSLARLLFDHVKRSHS